MEFVGRTANRVGVASLAVGRTFFVDGFGNCATLLARQALAPGFRIVVRRPGDASLDSDVFGFNGPSLPFVGPGPFAHVAEQDVNMAIALEVERNYEAAQQLSRSP